jgi:hypothetical protein
MRGAQPTLRLTVGFLGALLAAALVSCGGDSVSPQEFRADAGKVCRDVQRELDRIQATSPQTADQAEQQADAILEVSEQALDNLEKVDAPEELAGGYERYLRAREEAIGFIEGARDAAAENDSSAYVRAKRRLAEQQPTRRQLAIDVGLDDCSQPSLPAGAR